MEGLVVDTGFSSQGTMMDGFFLEAHIDMSLRLTEGYMHSLTKGCTDEEPWMGWPDHIPSGCPLI
jgi:hypothetical protein